MSKVPSRSPCQIAAWLSASRGGGEQTYFAPSKSMFSPRRSSAVKATYWGQVSA